MDVQAEEPELRALMLAGLEGAPAPGDGRDALLALCAIDGQRRRIIDANA